MLKSFDLNPARNVIARSYTLGLDFESFNCIYISCEDWHQIIFQSLEWQMKEAGIKQGLERDHNTLTYNDINIISYLLLLS